MLFSLSTAQFSGRRCFGSGCILTRGWSPRLLRRMVLFLVVCECTLEVDLIYFAWPAPFWCAEPGDDDEHPTRERLG